MLVLRTGDERYLIIYEHNFHCRKGEADIENTVFAAFQLCLVPHGTRRLVFGIPAA